MVLHHGKDVLTIPPPQSVPKDQEGWLIEETNEWFGTYEGFIARMDFYQKKQFTDSISRHTKLSFFEALRTEQHGYQTIEADFPEALRGPILRKVHLDTTGRLEDLVASLFNHFNRNILPGESVYVLTPERRTRTEGVVRDKVVYAANKDRPGSSKFSVVIPSDVANQPVEILVQDENIQRKPKTFTKAAITQYLRYTVDRDKYDGAPWVVKQPYADRYGLDPRIPNHLTADAIAAERRAQTIAKRGRPASGLPQGFLIRNNEIIPRPGHNPSQRELQWLHERYPASELNGQQVLHVRAPANGKGVGGHFGEMQLGQPPAPPVKYPIEDLDLEPRRSASQRPPLKDFTKFCPFPDPSVVEGRERLEQASVGLLLEVWAAFTVYGPSFYYVDGFTLDDLFGTMLVSSEKVPCQMFSELHSAVLQRLVDHDGELLVKSLANVLTAEEHQQEYAQGDDSDSEMKDADDDAPPSHRAAEMAKTYNWIRIVQSGELSNGGWQVAMVGLLEHISRAIKVYRPACNAILEQLAPLDQAATKNVAKARYSQLGINLRLQALQLATRMAVETNTYKNKMNEIMGGATATRKEKTSTQTQRKTLMRQLEELNQQRKLKRPDNVPTTNGATPAEEPKVEADEDLDIDDEPYSERSRTEETEDEDASAMAMNRRKSDRMANLKRKRDEEEEIERVEKLQMDKKEAAEYTKILKEIRRVKDDIARCEEQIAALDDDLRENFCHRTKLIGRDRFINRYHWFERNGMPLEGDKDSSTVYGYANGRLWVQGGDVLDRQGIIDLEPADEKLHRSRFKMSIQERRDLDEGATQLNDANEWGYYDEPEEIDRLLAWLKDKGEREKKLKKELTAWQEPIVRGMENLKRHMIEVKKRVEDGEEQRPQRGLALRKKAAAAAEVSTAKYPCALWTNSTAMNEFGMLLTEGRVEYPSDEEEVEEEKPPEKPARKRKAAAEETREASAVPEKRATRRGTRFAR